MVSDANTSSSTGSDSDDGNSRTARMFFLALIMLTSCVLGFFLLYSVLQSRKVRRSVGSIVLVNLVVVSQLDVFLNMTLVMGSLAAGDSWTFDTAACKWHALVMNIVLIETALLLTVLACDRFLAVKFLHKYDSMISPARVGFVVVFTWVQSVAFSIPFVFNVVQMTFRPKLHTCSVSEETPLAFICVASVLCFLAPTVILVVMFVLIFRLNYQQKHNVKIIKAQNHYMDNLMEEPRLWKEMLTVKYVCVLCLLWFVLEIPHVITTYIQQYRLSSELSFSVDYPWGVDVAFIWMRFSFSAVFPCATFIWRKDLWNCCKECVICHRSNSVLDIQVKVNPNLKPGSLRDLAHSVSSKSKEREHSRTDPPTLLSFNVPVLFATSDGIHIESPHSDASDQDDADVEFKGLSLKGRQLDVEDPNSADILGETSDYDSINEGERCSAHSQPLSARHIRGALETDSLKDVVVEGQNERGVASVGDLADSGLELSGTAGMLRQKSAVTRHHINEESIGILYNTAVADSPSVLSGPGLACPQLHKDTDESNSASVVAGPCPDACGLQCSEEPSGDSHCDPPPLPKAQGRLKPLHPAKKPKPGKNRQSQRGTVSQSESQTSGGTEPKSKNNSGEQSRGSAKKPGKSKQQSVLPSSEEVRGKGHKRTVTSDSEKALLDSNSSVELQYLKSVHSSETLYAVKQPPNQHN